MNNGGDNDIETQLLEMELRRPPAHWKAMILRPPPTPWFPKPFVIGLAACWTATLVLILTTPPVEKMEGPVLRPAFDTSPPLEDLLGYNTTRPTNP